jgi:hypothetical protein
MTSRNPEFLPEVARGRPRADHSQLFKLAGEGLKSKEFRTIHQACEAISKRYKFGSKEAVLKRLYRNRYALSID